MTAQQFGLNPDPLYVGEAEQPVQGRAGWLPAILAIVFLAGFLVGRFA